RWAEAEKKIKIEEKRWQKEEEIEKLNLSIGKVEQALKDLNKKANVLEEEKQFYQAVKILLDLINQGSELEIFFNQKDNVGKTLKERHVELTADLERLENKINQVRQQEELIEKAVKDLKVKEKTAESPAERRKIGQELWQKEKQRKISEEERWSLEKQKEDLQQKFNLIKTNFKQKEGEFIKIKNEQSRVFNGIKDSHFWFNLLEIKTKITQKQNDRTNVKKDIGEVKIKNDFNKALDEVITSDNAQREKVLTIVKTSAEQQLKAAQVKDFQEQKKREEDKLKAIERRAKEESEDKSKVLQGPLVKEEILKQLTRVSEKEEQQRREFLARVSGTANNFTFNHQVENKEDKAMILKPLAKKISSTKKIIWRGVIILFGLCLLVFLIWQFIFKNKLFFPKAPNNEEPPIFYQEPTPNNENETLWSELEWEPEPETFLEPPNIEVITTTTLAQIELEPDLIKVEAVQLLSFTNTEEIPLLLTNLIAENNLPASSFKRIVFASSTANQVLSTKDMLDLLDVSIDENFMRRLERIDFLLYKAKEGVRFVLIAKTSESNALVANFALFEKNGFQGLKPLFQFLGFLGKPISQNFKISQTSPKFKYQTVTKNDLGVCYLIYQDYFVISSSYEAMEAVIRKLSL
ncbi:hypothetical protein FJ208_01220, partial [Candidatus Gribaldobacteria bacterium]|nr:hypothetical protein [Candidatus Gribaldobacteria bacterium]